MYMYSKTSSRGCLKVRGTILNKDYNILESIYCGAPSFGKLPVVCLKGFVWGSFHAKALLPPGQISGVEGSAWFRRRILSQPLTKIPSPQYIYIHICMYRIVLMLSLFALFFFFVCVFVWGEDVLFLCVG